MVSDEVTRSMCLVAFSERYYHCDDDSVGSQLAKRYCDLLNKKYDSVEQVLEAVDKGQVDTFFLFISPSASSRTVFKFTCE
ncbi:hypothetical protein OK016_02125 [Vibrio chagasii]|nr:hypothetical protein [Vibrio chagasii]